MALYEVTRTGDYPPGALCDGLVIASGAAVARRMMADRAGCKPSEFTATRMSASGQSMVLSLYWDERSSE